MKLTAFFLLFLYAVTFSSIVWSQKKKTNTTNKTVKKKITFLQPVIETTAQGFMLKDTYWRVTEDSIAQRVMFVKTNSTDTLAPILVHFKSYHNFVLHLQSSNCRKQVSGTYWLDIREEGATFPQLSTSSGFYFPNTYEASGCSYQWTKRLSHVQNYGYHRQDTFYLDIDMPKGMSRW